MFVLVVNLLFVDQEIDHNSIQIKVYWVISKICFIYHDMSRSELHFRLVDTVAVTLLGFIVAVRTKQM